MRFTDDDYSELLGVYLGDGCIDFSNNSKEIIDLFVRACDVAGVRTRVNCHRGQWDVRINRRESVALMLDTWV